MNSIIIVTSSYPFGQKETYLENELNAISDKFDKIYLLPIYNPYSSEIKRKIPNNTFVLPTILLQGKDRIIQFLINFEFNSSYFSELFTRRVLFSRTKLKKWFNSYVLYVCSSKILTAFVEKYNPDELVIYSYWAEAPFFLNKKFSPYKKVVRMHGGDFYENRNSGYLPMRNVIYQNADLLLPISIHIYSRLIDKYRIPLKKIFLSYLGVNNTSLSCSLKFDSNVNFISCSNIYPLKRIDLIFDILRNLDSSKLINWTHIGDGESANEVREYINKYSQKNLNVNFVGQKSQTEISTIYQTHYFDFFINTSEHEGLPVSIMEAFSYGIPAIATDVGGTSEIVNSNNGLLIDRDFIIEEVVQKIDKLIDENNSFLRSSAFETWFQKFNGTKNYNKLYEKLSDKL